MLLDNIWSKFPFHEESNWYCGGLYLLLYCTYSLWRKFNCVKIPQGEANKSANRWDSFGAKGGVVPPSVFNQRVYAQSFFLAQKSNQKLGFLLPWISPWFFVGFLLSPPPYAQSFLRKPSFLVFSFFPWFFKSKHLLGFLGVVYMLK